MIRVTILAWPGRHYERAGVAAFSALLPDDRRGSASKMVRHDEASPDNAVLTGRVLGRSLRILDRLGSTAEGELYQGEYPDRPRVAVLVLASGAGEEFVRATRIQHPNVAAVHEVGRMEDGSTYVVLEQVSGEPLSWLLSQGQVFSLGEAVDLVRQAAAGLMAAHREGFVHGHLSPDTLLVTRTRFGQAEVKLSGFTTAKAPTPEGASAEYASPERRAGKPPSERTEVFSLGAVLHHLLTGRPPDAGQVDRSVPKIARGVLRTALAPLPNMRFQTILQLDEALLRLAAAAAHARRPRLDRFRIGAVAAGLILSAGVVWLFSSATWRATSDGPPPPAVDSAQVVPKAPVRAPSETRVPPADQRSAVSRRSPSTRSPKPASARRPRSPSAAPADAAPEYSIDGDTAAEEDVLGYRAEPEAASAPNPPPDRTPASAVQRPRVAPPVRTTADPRPRAELEQDQGLRQSIGDVIRLGLAENVTEIRPGFLVVALTPAAMEAPSVTYNLQRLYLAYSAATRQRDEVALELRQGNELYGWFTRSGLVEARPE